VSDAGREVADSKIGGVDTYEDFTQSGWTLIVGSLSGSRLKSVRFLVGESNEAVTSYEAVKIIKINH
jgi:hypothetical protein